MKYMSMVNGHKSFLESIIVPLEKNGGKECVDFRTINLLTYASKIVQMF